MADRNRRKSSILKLPKTRAPLQDVNALDIKSSSDDEITSHTALRRRVSFAGKNFVKEFCAEAEIASVFHAPEYEQLLLTSDSSNNTHSDTASDNNSTIQNRTQTSVYRSTCIQEDFNPCEQILREYKGNSSSQITSSQPKTDRKTRFSFGEIRIPNFEDDSPVDSPIDNQNSKTQGFEVPKKKDEIFYDKNKQIKANEANVKETINQNVCLVPLPSAQTIVNSKECGNAELDSEKPVEDMHPADATQFLDESMDFTRALPVVIETNTAVPDAGYNVGFEKIMSRESTSHSKTQALCSSMEFTTALTTNILTHQQEANTISKNVLCDEKNNLIATKTADLQEGDKIHVDIDNAQENNTPFDKTAAMCTSMEFTTALPSNIRAHLQESDNVHMDIENTEENNTPSNKTVAMSTTMEFTTALPSNIRAHLQESDNVHMDIENTEENNTPSNKTVAMSTTMEFTTALPSNIRAQLQERDKIHMDIENAKDNNTPFDKTTVMCTSMEFTAALPSNIRAHLQESDTIHMENAEEINKSSTKTVAISSSKDLKRPVPSISISDFTQVKDLNKSCENAINRTEYNISLSNTFAASKVAETSTHLLFGMEETVTCQIPCSLPDMPSQCILNETDMQLEGNELITSKILKDDDVRQVSLTSKVLCEANNNPSNKTVAMSSTMEFTTALPSNIQAHLQDRDKIHMDIENAEENNKTCCDKTSAMCSSMEFTTALPSNIRAHLQESEKNHMDIENAVANKTSYNKTVAMSSSMEFTTALPSNIRAHLQESDKIHMENAEEINKSSTKTVAMSSSMDLIRPVPSISMSDFTQGKDLNKSCENAINRTEYNISLSKTFAASKVAETSTHLLFGMEETVTCQIPRSLPDMPSQCILNETDMQLEGHELITSKILKDDDVCQVSLTSNTSLNLKKSHSSISATVHAVEASDTSLNCLEADVQVGESRSESPGVLQLDKFAASVSKYESVSHFTRTMPPVQPATTIKELTPTTQQISADANSQVLKKINNSLSADQIIKHFAPEGQSRDDFDSIPNPFQSRPQLLSSPKQGGIEAVVVQTSQQLAVSTASALTSQALISRCSPDKNVSQNMVNDKKTVATPIENGDDFNPFQSKPCLKTTPVKANACVAETSNSNVLASKSMVDGPLLDILTADCNLSDVQAPFHEYPSNSTIDISVSMPSVNLRSDKNAEMLLPDNTEQVPENFSDQMEYEANVKAAPLTLSPECHQKENLYVPNEDRTTDQPDVDNSTQSMRSYGSTVEKEGICSDKSGLSKSTKRIRDSSEENTQEYQGEALDSQVSKRIRGTSWESQQMTELPKVTSVADLKSRLGESLNRDSCCSDATCSEASLSSSAVLSVDDLIYSYQMKPPHCWDATKSEGTDLWTFKFICTALELKVCLKPSVVNGNIEAHSGYFVYNVDDSTKPIIRWGMKILQNTLSTPQWAPSLHHCPDFMSMLQNIVDQVWPVRKFIIETILQQGSENIKISSDSLYFDVVSFKCHLWFQVHMKLDFWENYTPDHISVNNVVGITRESEVKNLITGVEKDVYFLRNYIRVVKEYVKTLEEFCR